MEIFQQKESIDTVQTGLNGFTVVILVLTMPYLAMYVYD